MYLCIKVAECNYQQMNVLAQNVTHL